MADKTTIADLREPQRVARLTEWTPQTRPRLEEAKAALTRDSFGIEMTEGVAWQLGFDIEAALARIDALEGAVREARAALHQHYVDWDGEPEDAVPLQLARAKCDAALTPSKGEDQ